MGGRAVAACIAGVVGVICALAAACSERDAQGLRDSPSVDSGPARRPSKRPLDDASADAASPTEADDELGADPFPVLDDEWVAIPGSPSWCPGRVRLRPRTAERALRFGPCRGGAPGCAEYVIAGGAQNVRRYLLVDTPPFVVHGKPHFLLRRMYHDRGEVLRVSAVIDTLASVDGEVAFEHAGFFNLPRGADDAVRTCGNSFAFAGDRAFGSFLARDEAPDGGSSSRYEALWSAVMAEGSAVTAHEVPLGPFGTSGPDRLAPNGDVVFTTFFTDMTSPSVVALRFPSWEPIAPPSAPGLRLFKPLPVAGGAIIMGGPDYVADHVYFVADSGDVRRLWSPAPGRSTGNIAIDRASGERAVWLSGDRDGMIGTNWDLWTAPVAPGAAGFAARCVGAMPDGSASALVANAGVAVVTNEDHHATLMRLSDGATWQVPNVPAFKWLSPLWVDDTYVWLTAATNITTTNAWWTGNAVVRLERSRFVAGAPLPACGQK